MGHVDEVVGDALEWQLGVEDGLPVDAHAGLDLVFGRSEGAHGVDERLAL